jgi:hypothetical protein
MRGAMTAHWHYSRARWGPAHFPRVLMRKWHRAARTIACLRIQDIGRSNHIHQRIRVAHTSPSLSQSQVMRQLLYYLSDNPSTVDAVIETQLYHGCQPGAYGRVTVLTSDGWAIKVELKLHLQMGRSSLIPPEVVATSGSVARMKYEINLGEFQNTLHD